MKIFLIYGEKDAGKTTGCCKIYDWLNVNSWQQLSRDCITTLWAIILIIMFTITFSSCSSGGRDGSVELIPVKMTDNGNWSMINRDGKIVFDGEFKNRPSLAEGGVFSVEEGGLYTLYKTNGKQPVALPGCEGLKEAGSMSGGVIPVVFPNQRIKLLNSDGKEICTLGPVNGKEVAACYSKFQEGLLVFCVIDDGEKWGFIDKSGKVVIQPIYNYVKDFEDEVTVCRYKKKDSTTDPYVVIDHKGKVLFEVERGLTPYRNFKKGLLLLQNEKYGINYLIDKKGNKRKLPSQIAKPKDFNGDYIIFATEDGYYGVANIKGEICIRPKYEDIRLGIGNKFLAKKPGVDNLFALNTKGETITELDYSDISVLNGEFGYCAKEGGKYIILGEDFKQKGISEFVEVERRYSEDPIQSDYFNPNEVVSKITKNIHEDGFGEYEYGESASEIFSEHDATRYIPEIVFMDCSISGFKYGVDCVGCFSNSVTAWENGGYVWNDQSKLLSIRVNVYVPLKAKKETAKQLCKAIMTRGYKTVSKWKIVPPEYEDEEEYEEEDEDDSMEFNFVSESNIMTHSGDLYSSLITVKYEEESQITIDMNWDKVIDKNDHDTDESELIILR